MSLLCSFGIETYYREPLSNMDTFSPREYDLDEGTSRQDEALRKARAEVERLERMEF